MKEEIKYTNEYTAWAVFIVCIYLFGHSCNGSASNFEHYLKAKYNYEIESRNYKGN